MDQGPRLGMKDYVMWLFTMLFFFAMFMIAGDFGRLGYLASSPTGDYVQQLWSITYLLASIIFGVFMGSLVFLAVRFRAGAVQETAIQVESAKPTDYTKVALPILIVVGFVFVYVISQFLSIPSTSGVEFDTGMLGGLGLFLLGAVIFVVYKQYYKD